MNEILRNKVFGELVTLTHECMGTSLQPLAAILPQLGILVASENREALRQVALYVSSMTLDTRFKVDMPQGRNIGMA